MSWGVQIEPSSVNSGWHSEHLSDPRTVHETCEDSTFDRLALSQLRRIPYPIPASCAFVLVFLITLFGAILRFLLILVSVVCRKEHNRHFRGSDKRHRGSGKVQRYHGQTSLRETQFIAQPCVV